MGMSVVGVGVAREAVARGDAVRGDVVRVGGVARETAVKVDVAGMTMAKTRDVVSSCNEGR